MFEIVYPTGGFSCWTVSKPAVMPVQSAVPGFPSYMCHHLDLVVAGALVGPFPDVVLFDDHEGTSYEFLNTIRWDPFKFEGPYSPIDDSVNFGGGILTFLHVIPKNASELVRLSGEQEYYLSSLLGRGVYLGHSEPLSPETRYSTSSGYGYNYRALPLDVFHHFVGRSSYKIVNDDPMQLVYGLSNTSNSYLLIERLEDLKQAIEAGDVSTGRAYGFNWVSSSYTKLDIKTSMNYMGVHVFEAELTTRYKLDPLIGTSGYAEIDEVTNYVIKYQTIGRPIDVVNDGLYHEITVLQNIRRTTTYSNYRSIGGTVAANWALLVQNGTAESSSSDVVTAFIMGNIGEVDLTNLPMVKIHINTLISDWNQWLEQHRGTFYSHSFYATAKAVTNYGAGADLNLLEFFTEWSSWLDLPSMNLIRTLGRFDFRSRNWPRLVKSLVDVLTDIKLWYSFGARPNAEIVITGADKLIGELNGQSGPDLMGWKTLYGRRSMDLPMDGKLHHDSLKSCSIESNSKIRVRFDPGSFAVSALSLRQAGIAPNLSNIWDCLRWTWLLDMVTNVGAKLQAVDNQLILLALPNGVCSHSYRLRSVPDVVGLTDLGLTITDPLELFCYDRKASLLLPALRDAEVDFSPPPEIDWAIVGSFLWKISGLSTGL